MLDGTVDSSRLQELQWFQTSKGRLESVYISRFDIFCVYCALKLFSKILANSVSYIYYSYEPQLDGTCVSRKRKTIQATVFEDSIDFPLNRITVIRLYHMRRIWVRRFAIRYRISIK